MPYLIAVDQMVQAFMQRLKISQENWAPHILPFKLTQDHWNQHWLIYYLLVFC